MKPGRNQWKLKKLILNNTSEYNLRMSNCYNNCTYKMISYGKYGHKIYLNLIMKKILGQARFIKLTTDLKRINPSNNRMQKMQELE